MDGEINKQDDVARPETARSSISPKQLPPTKRLDMVVPPPVPEKDTPPALQRPMTGSSKRLSFTTMSSAQKRKIKYGQGKYASVELVPQPSDDLEDPLNWPQWRKELNLVSLLMIVGLIGGMKTVFITTNERMAVDFNVSYTAVAALTAVPIMLSAVTGTVASIAARIRGKRPVYLASFPLIFIGTIWNMTTRKSFGSCMGARIFQGLGWGAFDALVLGSIKDTYFEHERHLRMSIYNIFTIATTWGPPLIGGIASENAGSFTVQFRIINTFYLVAIPLLAFGAPETAFDRSKAPIGLSPAPSFAASSILTRHTFRGSFNKRAVMGYLAKMHPLSFRGSFTLSTVLQLPRAICAPTTSLTFLLSFIPYCTLWGIAASLALMLNVSTLGSNPTAIGAFMTGPWVSFLLTAVFFCLQPNFTRKFGPLMNILFIIATGAALALIGILSFGLTIRKTFSDNTSTHRITLSLLSFLFAIFASSAPMLDATTRPLIARSASFTSPSAAISQRSITDMETGVVLLRNLFIGIFVVAFPQTSVEGLKAAVIGLGVVNVAVAGAVAALLWFAEKSVWRLDGRVMRLVDLSSLRVQSGSFFDTE